MTSSTVRRSLLALAALLFLPVAASAQLLHADLNGDGIGDRVDEGARPAEVIVRTSNCRHLQRLQAPDRIVRLALADVDRDGDPDLVASTTRLALRIWINNGRGHFSGRIAAGPLRRPRTVRDRLKTPAPGTGADEVGDSSQALSLASERPVRGMATGTRVRHLSRAPAARFRLSRRRSRAPPSILFL